MYIPSPSHHSLAKLSHSPIRSLVASNFAGFAHGVIASGVGLLLMIFLRWSERWNFYVAEWAGISVVHGKYFFAYTALAFSWDRINDCNYRIVTKNLVLFSVEWE